MLRLDDLAFSILGAFDFGDWWEFDLVLGSLPYFSCFHAAWSTRSRNSANFARPYI